MKNLLNLQNYFQDKCFKSKKKKEKTNERRDEISVKEFKNN